MGTDYSVLENATRVRRYRRRTMGWAVVMVAAWLSMLASRHLFRCDAAYIACLAAWAVGLVAWIYNAVRLWKETE